MVASVGEGADVGTLVGLLVGTPVGCEVGLLVGAYSQIMKHSTKLVDGSRGRSQFQTGLFILTFVGCEVGLLVGAVLGMPVGACY